MDLWIFLAITVVCFCLLEAYRAHTKSKSKASQAEIDDLRARLADLEGTGSLAQRVETLEAIVTDPKHQLNRELAGLKTESQAS